MPDSKIKNQIDKIRKQIREADFHYYVLNNPQISDKEYDNLYEKLIAFEKKYPQLITPDSPTQRVSGGLIKEFPTAKHKIKMLSLDNTYSMQDLIDWENRLRKNLKRNLPIEYMAELKIDGISCSLTYQNGELIKGLTRGDGQEGEDITANLRTIHQIPLKLRGSFPKKLEVRGEVYINKEEFKKLNTYRIKNKQSPFANPRNAAGGSLKLLNPKLTASRKLGCFIHSFGWVEEYLFGSQCQFLKKIKDWGLPTQKENKLCQNINQVIRYCNQNQKGRSELAYEVDGVVVKVNDLSLQNKLGSTLKSPRWAVAYKFPAIQKTTQVKNIELGVGRSGVITPVAILKPVECGGAKIKRATLHNFDEIQRLGLKIGDTVLIERAGDVIPKIIKVIPSKRTGSEKKIDAPKNCPICKSLIDKKDVYYFCLNPNCPSKIKKALIHFTSRAAMDIEGVGESLIKELTKKNFVKNIPDLYRLTKKELLLLPLFQDKKADNIIRAISESKNRPLSNLLFGLGIPHVGQKTALLLAESFGSIDRIKELNKEELENLQDIGPEAANSIVKFFKQKSVLQTLEDFKKMQVNLKQKSIEKSAKLLGKTLAFTGQLERFSRKQAQRIIEESGGKYTPSLSKKVDFLVAGNQPGSKLDLAKKKKIKVISEKDFLKLIEL